MAILNDVSKKTPGAKALIVMFYTGLIIGGISMIYPFLLMISGSMKGNYNSKRMNIWPQYMSQDMELYRAWSESKYLQVAKFNRATTAGAVDFDTVTYTPQAHDDTLVKAYHQFKSQDAHNPFEHMLGHVELSNMNLPMNGLRFMQHLSSKHGELEQLNTALGINISRWKEVVAYLGQNAFIQKGMITTQSPLDKEFLVFRESFPQQDFFTPTVDGMFRMRMIYTFAGTKLADIKEKTGLQLTHLNQISLHRTDGNAWFNEQRLIFMRQFLNPRYINLAPSAEQRYKAFIKENFRDSLASAQRIFPGLTSFDTLVMPSTVPTDARQGTLYNIFLERYAQPEDFVLTGPQIRFRHYLLKQHGSLDAINAALGSQFSAISDIYIPQQAMDWNYVMGNKSAIRWDLATMNFKFVISYLFDHGRAAWVTVIFCLLTIVTSLLVNPLAAYALSRYNLPTTYKVLMVLMATMAFPQAVTQIPAFLMLKDFNLLNTFWALILPGMANGYSIFILKGFFDSLPKELYEAASLDGASEFRMFFQITLNLSKPVLALIALNSFTAAYGNFMFALLICQDEAMWTIMVYLFQLQNEANQAVTFASLLIAAIPTFIIFVTCQNVIMRGIVVPSEK